MAYDVESYCIFVSLIFIYFAVCLPFIKVGIYNLAAELGISIGFAFNLLNFTFVDVCSILH